MTVIKNSLCERRHQIRRTEWYTDVIPCQSYRNDDIAISVD